MVGITAVHIINPDSTTVSKIKIEVVFVAEVDIETMIEIIEDVVTEEITIIITETEVVAKATEGDISIEVDSEITEIGDMIEDPEIEARIGEVIAMMMIGKVVVNGNLMTGGIVILKMIMQIAVMM